MFKKLGLYLYFPFFYFKEVVAGAWRITIDVLTPGLPLKPCFLEIPLEVKTPWQKYLLANLVTMTPGTLSIEIEENRNILIVHALYGKENPEAIKHTIKNRFEKIILQLLNPDLQ